MIFIVQITNSSKNDNLLHREITHLKNRNNKNEEIKAENNNEEIEKNTINIFISNYK